VAQDTHQTGDNCVPAVAEGLQAQLEQINAQVPAPVRDRIDAAIKDIDASGSAPGLSAGDTAPDFTLPDHLGRPVRLYDRLASGPVVLVFYRGEWCPFCNVHLRALQETLPQITAKGASLLAISPQARDHALAITEQAGLDFEVLSDGDQAAIKAYHLQFTSPADLQDLIVNVFGTDLRDHTADGSWRLPVPATFVVDRTGIVRAAHVSADFRTRLEPATILAALDELP
jgi:peroxiredoxin